MPESLLEFFSARFFMPHGHCYLWKPALLWLQVLSNGMIGIAYLAISATLGYLVLRIGDIPFRRMYLAFGLFIITCGITHFFDIYVIWTPAYWVDGAIRAITALASIGTAILLPPLIPKALALAEGAKAAHSRGVKLETMVKELESAYERARELEQIKTQFFANVSHELRTPLTLIMGPIERLLARPGVGVEERRELELAARNARTLLKHVNDLLDVSKLEAGKMDVRYTAADLARLVRTVASNFEGAARDRSLTYTVDTPDSLPATIDAEKIQRVLLNLLSNAFKFAPSAGKVRCTLTAAGDRAMLVVADDGPGVPAERRAAVFERFRQLDFGPARQFGGTGLGLAIVKDFVELHKGSVELEEAPEGGALFRVHLPLVAPDGASIVPKDDQPGTLPTHIALQVVEELRTRTEAAATAQHLGKPVVLVVEDNIDMAEFITRALVPDYDVVVAHDGEEGLTAVETFTPDLVISDVMMPRLSGDELVRRLRAQPQHDALPILMLTAKADDELRVKLLRDGAQDYVGKPFAVEELRARVANQVTMKRVREVLQRELDGQIRDLERLASEVTGKKRELHDALASLRAAHEQAELALKAKTHFLNLVSHELRTPLTAFALHLGSLERKLGDTAGDAERRLLHRLEESKDRLTGLVESLLEYARVESGRVKPDITEVNLADICKSVLDEHRPPADVKGLTLTLTIEEPQPPSLRSDGRLVRLVLGNLVGNAVKFTSTGGVGIEVATDGARQRVRVRDSGPGIPADQLPSIFDPFTHLEPIKGKHTPGFGLGLALVREMTDVLGAELKVESTPGEGSVFTVWFVGSEE